MRRIALLFLSAAALAACGHEATAPTTPTPQRASAEIAGAPAGGSYVAGLRRLSGALALTPAQRRSIRGYVRNFRQATQPDRQALASLQKQAREARRGGATREQVKAILQPAAAHRQHVLAAAAQLRQQIEGVLIADQKAWLAANAPEPCDRGKAPPLTTEQRTRIRTLVSAFREANQADLEAVRQATQRARDARQNGAAGDTVRANLAGVKPNAQRLRVARQKLAADIQAVLTAEQKASGCFRPGFGTRPARLGAFPRSLRPGIYRH